MELYATVNKYFSKRLSENIFNVNDLSHICDKYWIWNVNVKYHLEFTLNINQNKWPTEVLFHNIDKIYLFNLDFIKKFIEPLCKSLIICKSIYKHGNDFLKINFSRKLYGLVDKLGDKIEYYFEENDAKFFCFLGITYLIHHANFLIGFCNIIFGNT